MGSVSDAPRGNSTNQPEELSPSAASYLDLSTLTCQRILSARQLRALDCLVGTMADFCCTNCLGRANAQINYVNQAMAAVFVLWDNKSNLALTLSDNGRRANQVRVPSTT
ncbi:hypothetical protein Plhal703r1_c37g0133811 [Plasmopara halstedii]